jgi:hypothetical protein
LTGFSTLLQACNPQFTQASLSVPQERVVLSPIPSCPKLAAFVVSKKYFYLHIARSPTSLSRSTTMSDNTQPTTSAVPVADSHTNSSTEAEDQNAERLESQSASAATRAAELAREQISLKKALRKFPVCGPFPRKLCFQELILVLLV